VVIVSLEAALEMKKKTSHPKPLSAATQLFKKKLKMFFDDLQGCHLYTLCKFFPSPHF